jgi:DNA helicase-2/ATP-dependent DNA helicase PcrA
MSILREADIDEAELDGTDVEACLHKYLEVLADKRCLDFSTIVVNTMMMLEDEPDFRRRVGSRVRYLTVDEYQDVNPVQERLIRALADLGATLTVVGDDDQLLYAWRGSRVDNILEFPDCYDDVQSARLERNFRSVAASSTSLVKSSSTTTRAGSTSP